MNYGTVNITKGGLAFAGNSNNTDGNDVKTVGGSIINLDQGGGLFIDTHGYLQTGGALYAKGSTIDNIIASGAAKVVFNGGTVSMGDGSNTYNTLKVDTRADTYINGATFTFKIDTAMPDVNDKLEVVRNTLHIDKNNGTSTMQWTLNGTPVTGTWDVIVVDSGNNIDGDFTTKNLPAGYSEQPATSKWTLSRP